MIVGGNRLNEREIELMLRFAKVFQQHIPAFLTCKKQKRRPEKRT